MSKVGLYTGSFNPWHDGHYDVLKKALQVFDLVIIAVGVNPEKEPGLPHLTRIPQEIQEDRRVNVILFHDMVVDVIDRWKPTAIIRGLRNGQDLEYERTQQYWNEDLGCKIPTVYFVSDRKLVHISSSAIRAVRKFRDNK